jgi:hypothetical protein
MKTYLRGGLGAALLLAALIAPMASGGGKGGGGGGHGGGGGSSQDLLAISKALPDPIVKMGLDGTNVETVTSFAAFFPTWALAGYSETKILFAAAPQGDGVYSINPDGSGLTKLVSLTSANFRCPVISPVPTPSGTYKIVVEEVGSSGAIALYSMEADGSDFRQLTDPSVAAWHATWLPSGDRIVALQGSIGLAMYQLGVDSSGELEIESTTDLSTGGPLENLTLNFPCVSHSGDFVVVQAAMPPDGFGDIWIVPVADPASAYNLTNSADHDITPAFDATDEWVYYVSNANHKYQIWKTRTDGSGGATVVNASFYSAPWPK